MIEGGLTPIHYAINNISVGRLRAFIRIKSELLIALDV
jgi:hypothetical protein